MASALAAQGTPTPTPPTRARTVYEDLQMLTGVLNQLRINHPDSLDQHELIMAAVRGMVGAADPHSYVMVYQPLNAEKEKAWRAGKLVPVGLSFRMEGGAAVVVGVAPSLRARTDVLPGDELVAIDGKVLDARNDDEVELMLAGEKNTTVRLTLERRRADGTVARLDRDVKREKADRASQVPAAFKLDAQTGYVRVVSFEDEKVADDVHDAVSRLEQQGMKRLVLDLRDNPGGRVREAAQMSGEFLPKGALIYTQEGRRKELNDSVRVSRSFWRSERRDPVVILVNEGTASAAELVAGALQDHDRALLVGRPTFGKSLVMLPFPLPDGSVVWMVTGHVKTPCGRIIQRAYHGMSVRQYYRQALADRDTTGLPACTTDHGRRVFGGGGVVPDIRLQRTAVPAWLERVRELRLPLQWSGSQAAALPASLDEFALKPSLSDALLADFRRFAAAQGVAIPDDADASKRLNRELVRSAAYAKWGEAGYYRVSALLDEEVASALATFDTAQAILDGKSP